MNTNEKNGSPDNGADETALDEREIDQISAALAISDPQESDRSGDDERALVELLGMLPSELDPIEPSSNVKQRLFAELGLADGVAQSDSPVTLGQESAAAEVVPFRPPTQQPRWVGWLAAAAVLMAVGLAALSGVFYAQLSQQTELIGALESELASRDDAGSLSQTSALTQVRNELDEVRRQLGVVTSPGTKACRLDSQDVAQPGARGTVFMTDDGNWVLTASNLQKCKLGREYRVWFVTDDGKLNGGSFFVKDETTRVEIGADEMPAGTRAVMITLEYPGQAAEAPEGPTILFGDESREML